MLALIIATKKDVDAGFSMATLIGMNLFFIEKGILADTDSS
jgi:hypothetical protein